VVSAGSVSAESGVFVQAAKLISMARIKNKDK